MTFCHREEQEQWKGRHLHFLLPISQPVFSDCAECCLFLSVCFQRLSRAFFSILPLLLLSVTIAVRFREPIMVHWHHWKEHPKQPFFIFPFSFPFPVLNICASPSSRFTTFHSVSFFLHFSLSLQIHKNVKSLSQQSHYNRLHSNVHQCHPARLKQWLN